MSAVKLAICEDEWLGPVVCLTVNGEGHLTWLEARQLARDLLNLSRDLENFDCGSPRTPEQEADMQKATGQVFDRARELARQHGTPDFNRDDRDEAA